MCWKRPWVVIVETHASKYEPCSILRLRVVDLERGFSGRSGGTCDDEAVVPRRGDPLVVTSRGGLAWVRGGVLYRLGGAGSIRELDRGEVTGLRAEGDDVVWTRDGVERRATV